MSGLESVNEASFQSVISRDGLTLVDFWAPWCGPCRMLAPTLEKVQEEMSDQVKIVKLNIDENPNLAGTHKVQNIPLVIAFKAGQVVETVMGNKPKKDFVALVERHS